MKFLHRTWAEIDISALRHNFEIIKHNAGNSKIMAVVKADAYGHGVCDIAPVLQQEGADAFAVSNIEEALQLRSIGIVKPVLILGYTPPEAAKELAENNISQCVYSLEYAENLSRFATENSANVKIHIKLDTGMSRLGFDCRNENLSGLAEAVASAKLPGLSFEGIFTHFAAADRTEDEEDGFTKEQFDRFSSAVEYFKENGLKPEFCHCCNSAAMMLDGDKRLDFCRPGIILYGLLPSPKLEFAEKLIPVMTLKSVVSMVKEISAGDTVSYGRTFKADRTMRIATVSAGYADGYPRLLSNKGYVVIKGKKAPLIGRVCMDQMLIDVTEIDNVKMGDEVILFGKELSVDELATVCGTINYEIVCDVSKRVPRIRVDENE